MVGIYRITNNITGQTYVGQSRNIEKRFAAHRQHKTTLVGSEIEKYGINNFTFEVLEECEISELDDREDFYIQLYDSICSGYNKIRGGQHNRGESNSNCKLSEDEVYKIREHYKNHDIKRQVYLAYKDTITFGYFSNVWEGRSWPDTHYDVYTPENIEYYRHTGMAYGVLYQKCGMTQIDILNMRQRYMTETAKEIYESYKNHIQYQTLQSILWGRSYKDLPIYLKQEKRWINHMKPVTTISVKESTSTIDT